MPVDTKSEYYELREDQWMKISTIIAGDEAIKEAAETYLPKLGGQDDSDYQAYRDRGSFFNATGRTICGLTGAVMRKDPDVEVPSNIEPFLEDITSSGLSFQEVTRDTVGYLLSHGTYGILVDMSIDPSETPRPYFATYTPFDIINWRTKKIGSKDVLTLLVLAEEITKPNEADTFETEKTEQIRVLSLDEETGKLTVQLWQKEMDEESDKSEDVQWNQIDVVEGVKDFIPKARGKPLDYIPFVFFGALDNTPIPSKPPLLDLANLNIKHWQVSVDYYHGLHFCALPTPWAAGWPKDTKLHIGPGKAWVSEDSSAQCGFLEFTGSGLKAVDAALSKLEKLMAVLGARMLEEQRKAVESAETARIRASEDTATLSTIVGSVNAGMTVALGYMCDWLGTSKENIVVTLNSDYISQQIPPAEITALLSAYQAQAISLDTFLHKLKTGEILPKGRTVDEEKVIIEAEAPEEFEEFPPEEEEEEEPEEEEEEVKEEEEE